jgi:hypothetical protein
MRKRQKKAFNSLREGESGGHDHALLAEDQKQ